nr:hypothetical protein [Frankia sp. Cas4]
MGSFEHVAHIKGCLGVGAAQFGGGVDREASAPVGIGGVGLDDELECSPQPRLDRSRLIDDACEGVRLLLPVAL